MSTLSHRAAQFVLEVKPLLIENVFLDGEGSIAVEDPATAKVIANLGQASTHQIDLAVVSARRAFEGEWGRLSAVERSRLLFRLADLLERDQQVLAELEPSTVGYQRFWRGE